MNPTVSGVSDREKPNVSIRPIQNGFNVCFSLETKKLTSDGNSFLYDYINETYAFETIEEAVEKAKELLS